MLTTLLPVRPCVPMGGLQPPHWLLYPAGDAKLRTSQELLTAVPSSAHSRDPSASPWLLPPF